MTVIRNVSLVMAYYENPAMLREQYARLAELPGRVRTQLELVLVDDGSPDNPAWVQDVGLPVQLFRMKQDIRWNQDACRNIGVKYARNDWVLLTDMDHVVPVETWDQIFLGALKPDRVYTFRRQVLPDFQPYKHHPNSWLLARRDYESIGGYDERFAGWYGTDGDFRDRLARHLPIIQLSAPLMLYPRHVIADASTTRYLRKTPDDRANITRIKRERGEVYKTKRYLFEYERVA